MSSSRTRYNGDPSSSVGVWSEVNSASPAGCISESWIAHVDFLQVVLGQIFGGTYCLAVAAHDGKRFEWPRHLDPVDVVAERRVEDDHHLLRREIESLLTQTVWMLLTISPTNPGSTSVGVIAFIPRNSASFNAFLVKSTGGDQHDLVRREVRVLAVHRLHPFNRLLSAARHSAFHADEHLMTKHLGTDADVDLTGRSRYRQIRQQCRWGDGIFACDLSEDRYEFLEIVGPLRHTWSGYMRRAATIETPRPSSTGRSRRR